MQPARPVAKVRERNNRFFGNVDHTLQSDVWMGELLKGMGQHYHIKPIGGEAVQAVIDIFLNDIQSLCYCGDQIVGINIDANADRGALISKTR